MMATALLDYTEPVASYDQVLDRLDRIVEVLYEQNSRLGYFAALYRHVAIGFTTAIREQIFEQLDMIKRLDVIFFNRYLAALRQHELGKPPTAPWQVAFAAAASEQPTVLQHLLLGMSAHILFDLGISVAQVCPPAQLPQLEADFVTMNTVLGGLVADLRHDLVRIWPALDLFERAAGADEDGLLRMVIREGRTSSWNFALGLAGAANQQPARIDARAREVARRARQIWKPPLPLNFVAGLARLGERDTVRQTIAALVQRSRAPAPEPFLLRRPQGPRKKVAILGGGVGAITAAFALTDPENPLAEQYDVTIYQLGWRIGGKGASGRNQEHNYRIEEHGLHIWFGSYDNAFRVIQKCYAELGRPPDAPLASWREAFKPHSVYVLKEKVGTEWVNWISSQPYNDLTPGQGDLVLPSWQYVTLAVKLMLDLFTNSSLIKNSPTGNTQIGTPSTFHGLFDNLGSDLATNTLNLGLRLLQIAHALTDRSDDGSDLVFAALRRQPSDVLKWLGHAFEQFTDPVFEAMHQAEHALLIGILERFIAWLWGYLKDSIATNDEYRHVWIMLNFTYANLRGALREDVLLRGFDVLNEYDYREWLAKYAFDDGGVTLNSAFMLAIYDAMFAYVDGDNVRPPDAPFPPNARLEAGTAMRCGIRQFLLCKGAGVYKMQAGMGDTIFAPMYQVLKRRGVKFEFFHRVRGIHPSSDNRRIERITMSRQVELTPERRAAGGYDPLIMVKGLPCWPSKPLYQQIDGGDRLRAEGIDLEAYQSAEHDLPEFTLTASQDFDLVVLGISLGALPYVAPELIAASPKWKSMVDNIKTIRTQGFQIWLKPTAYEMGWATMDRPLGGAYDIDPIDTWADMSHLIDREGWLVEDYPQQLSYFCGAMRDDVPLPITPHGPMPAASALDQGAANQAVRAIAYELLNRQIMPWLPNATVANDRGELSFRWELLADSRPGASGVDRLDAQYFRGNVQPSERYVLSVPGSSKYRLPANDPTEFANLYLAGDWTQNGYNIGCVEAATMSGLLAANAIAGYPHRSRIAGLDLLSQDDDGVPPRYTR